MKNIFKLLLALTLLNAQEKDSCYLTENQTDEFTGITKKVHEVEGLYVDYLDEKKRNVYLYIEVKAAKIDSMFVLYWSFLFQTKTAYDTYGAIRKDSKIMVMLDDSTIQTLYVNKSDYGDVDYDKRNTFYSTYTLLTRNDVETLSNNEAIKIRVYWSKGYDDYELTLTDIIKNQLSCIK